LGLTGSARENASSWVTTNNEQITLTLAIHDIANSSNKIKLEK